MAIQQQPHDSCVEYAEIEVIAPPVLVSNFSPSLYDGPTAPAKPQHAAPERMFIERFLDSFFQPANIRWLLIIGAAIVLASSLMLVTKQWSSWPAAIKFTSILCYTGAIYCFAEFADRRLGLKLTGNVLRGLTVLLLPVMMLGLSWVATLESWTGLGGFVEACILLVPAASLMFYSSRNVFHHFLREHQTTFLVSYGLMSLAACVPAAQSPWLAMTYLCAFWGAMTIGVIKVNRHVFWLAEEHKLPRVFGFFPILLLGSQFVFLVGSKVLNACPAEWLGTSLVMFAGTVLLTARSVANVYRARTGDLVRPLPWSIALPLVTGVLMTIAGAILSCWGFSFTGLTSTFAVVPTAIMASVLMLMVANDTRHAAFTWIAIVMAVIAYQASPILFKDLLMTLKASAAQAVQEDRLPGAFYGITYLPLFSVMAIASLWMKQRNRDDIGIPLQHFVTSGSMFLWSFALLNLKAAFLVSLLNVAMFVGYAFVFRDRRYAYAALAGVSLICLTAEPFANVMFGWRLSVTNSINIMLLLGVVLYSTRFVDRCISRFPLPDTSSAKWMLDQNGNPICFAYYCGIAMNLVIAIGWLMLMILLWNTTIHQDRNVTLLVLAAVSMIVMRTQNYFVSMLFAMIALVASTSYLSSFDRLMVHWVEYGAMVCTLVSFVGLSIVQFTSNSQMNWGAVRTAFGLELPSGRVVAKRDGDQGVWSQALGWVRCHVIALSDLATCLVLLCAVTHFVPKTFVAAMNCFGTTPLLWSSSCIFLWLVACGTVLRSRMAACAVAVVAPLYAAAAINTAWPTLLNGETLPLAVVCTASAVGIASHLVGWRHWNEARIVCLVWLGAIGIVGCVYMSWPIRLAAGISLATILFVRGGIRNPSERVFLAIVGNLHVLLLVAGFSGLHGWLLENRPWSVLETSAIALFPAFVASMLFADRVVSKWDTVSGVLWGACNTGLALVTFAIALFSYSSGTDSALYILTGLSIAAYFSFTKAIKDQSKTAAWLTFGVGGMLLGWLWSQRLLVAGTGTSQVVLIAVAACFLWLSSRITGDKRFGVFASPMTMLGATLPAIVTGLSIVNQLNFVGHGVAQVSSITAAYNYLSLLAAAMVYFLHSMRTGQKWFAVMAAVILNVAIITFSKVNGFNDPQFYCVPIGLSIVGVVELLRRELPTFTHDPLRYIGSLLILVSPVFGMMDSSWLHLFSLMVLCVLVIVIAIGLRVRALIYTGSAFLLADLSGMVVRSTIDNPTLLWVGGIGLGVTVIALAAVCENHRENLISKIRMLSSELATWN